MFAAPLQKEQLGLAHLFTLASRAKLTWDEPRVDIDSVDVMVRAVDISGPDVKMSKPALDIQLKSTVQLPLCTDDHNAFSFDLPVKNYNDLRDERRAIPIVLVVYLLPEQEDDWVDHTDTRLITKKCAYWCSIKGQVPTDNTSTVRVKIPKANVLSPTALRSILEQIAKTGEVSP